MDQGTHSLAAGGTQGERAAHGLTGESPGGILQPERGQGVAMLPRAWPGLWWILGPSQKHILSQVSLFLPE